MAIATDGVDPELVERPRRWDLRFIRNFMIVFGGISSVFDFLTFGVLLWLLACHAGQFRSGWFVESVLTELVIAAGDPHPPRRSSAAGRACRWRSRRWQ